MYTSKIQRQIEMVVEVEYTYHPACRGERERGTGLPLEPDEPEHIEIESVTDQFGNTIELSNDEYAELEEDILEELQDRDDADI